MPTINMIAARRSEKRRHVQNLKRLVYGLGAEVLCISIALGVLSVQAAGVRGHIDDLSTQLQKLGPQVKQINDLEAQTAALRPKVDTLDGAKSDTLFWYGNLSAIAASLPAPAWLTSLSTTAAAPPSGSAPGAADTPPGAAAGQDPTVSLSGVTLTSEQVGAAMLRMNSTPGLDHVDLAFVQQQKTGDTDTVSFQMTVHLKPQPSAVKKTASEGASTNVQKS